MAAYLGCTLEIETKDGKFEGVLIDIETGSKKITLNKVKVKSSGKRIRTPCHFYGNEVIELKVIPDKNKSKTSPRLSPDIAQTSPDNPITEVLHNGTTTTKLSILENEKTSSQHRSAEISKGHGHTDQVQRDARESASVNENVTTRRERDASPPQARPVAKKKSAASTSNKLLVNSWQELKKADASTKGYILIDKIGSDFRKVIQHLKEQHFLGLAAGGVNLGRRGELHIVQIYSDEVTYIFDVQSLGAALFNHERGGLGEVLESHSVVKVMHDCRWVSDLLHHRYGIQLNCVYDTQVSDVLVRRQEKGGEIPRYTRGLAECLLEYLEISISEVYSKMIHNRFDTEEEFLWDERPLNSDLLDSAVRNVRYLLDLRVATLRRLMGELMCATHIYLTSVRDTPDNRSARGQKDPSLVPYGLMDLFRRGFRGTSDVYEEFQFGSVGEGDARTSNGGAVPWDLWQPGQKLNPSLHKNHTQSQSTNATTMPGIQASADDSKSNQHNPMLAETLSMTLPKSTVQGGMPGGAEEDRLSDEASDSDEADVFGGEDAVYSWRRKPTVEGDDEQQAFPDNRTLPDKQDVKPQRSKVSSTSTYNTLVQNKREVSPSKAETYQKDKNLYEIPIVKCATDLYNLPVNGIETSSTDDDSSPVEETEGASEESGYKMPTVKLEAQEPIQWPVVDSSSDFIAKPAGIEEGTLFEALPSGNENSPHRSGAECHQPTEDFRIALSLATGVPREGSPLSIPDLEEYEEATRAEDQDVTVQSSRTTYHVNSKGATIQVNSQSHVKSEMPFKPSPHSPVDTHAPVNLNYSEQKLGEQKSGASFYTPKGPVQNKKTRHPDQSRYIPPRMRNLPPRFRNAYSADNRSNACNAPEQYSTRNGQSNAVANRQVFPSSIVESGSESSSSSSSGSTGSSTSSNNASSSSKERSNQGSPFAVERSRSGPHASSRPTTFGEMMASLSDSNQGRDSDSSVGDVASGGEMRLPSASEKTTSSGSEDLAMSQYEEMIAARAAAASSQIGRGRARALTASVDHLPSRRITKKKNMTTLGGYEVRMDYPSEYEIQHAPKAVPIRANSHLLSVKTIGRGGRF